MDKLYEALGRVARAEADGNLYDDTQEVGRAVLAFLAESNFEEVEDFAVRSRLVVAAQYLRSAIYWSQKPLV